MILYGRGPGSSSKVEDQWPAQGLITLGRAIHHQGSHPSRVLFAMLLRGGGCPQLLANRSP